MPGDDSTHDANARGLVAGGKVFQRYTLRRALGQGGMGVVWLARDEKLEQEVALKFVADTWLHDPNAIERLKRETRRNLQLAHPNIVRIHDFVQDEHAAAIAMEFINGWSLWAMRVDRPHHIFSVEEITPWIRQLVSALDYAHREAQFVHRDLKPSNLLINQREQLKVSDFGIARSLGAQLTQTTGSGLVYGTVGYMSPQQALGEAPSVADDVYSLGATIYELLTGTPPFYKGEIMAQVMDLTPASMTERLHELGAEEVTIPWAWEDTVARCLAKPPAQRPASIAEVMRLLERTEAAPQADASAESDSHEQEFLARPFETQAEPSVQRAGRARNRFALLAAVSLVLLAVVVAGFLASRSFFDGSASAPTDDRPPALSPKEDKPPVASLNTTTPTEPTPPPVAPATTPGAPLTAGARDPAFHRIRIQGGHMEAMDAMAVQADGKILVGGYFERAGGEGHGSIVRFQPDGSVDPSFGTKAGGAVHGLAVQPDGKIILAGNFRTLNNNPSKTAGRIFSNGRFDSSFVVGSGGDLEARSIGLQPDGKVLISGSFLRFNGFAHQRLVRLHVNGAVDNTFQASFDWPPTHLVAQPDGKILVGGAFNRANGTAQKCLVRLRPDGSLDSSFQPPTSFYTKAVALLPDGKILIAASPGAVVRLNSNGSIDPTFQSVPLPNARLNALVVDSRARILVAGMFTALGNWPTDGVARLNSNGSLDRSFRNGHPLERNVHRLAVTTGDDVIASGYFSERLLRFLGSTKPAVPQ